MAWLTRNLVVSLVTIVAVLAKPESGSNSELEGKIEGHLEDALRLPKSLYPRTYNINYTNIDLEGKRFKGVAKITIHVLECTKNVALHKGRHLNITLTYVKSLDGRIDYNVDYFRYNETTEIVNYVLKDEFQVGDMVRLAFDFEGPLLDVMQGFYWSSFFNDGKGE